jgi:cellulose synthase (UDP-forming)
MTEQSRISKKQKWALMLPMFGITMALIYIISRTILLFGNDYRWYEYALAVLLLMAEMFLIMHGCGYMSEIIRVANHPNQLNPDLEPIDHPPLAVVVASYKEPLDVLEETLSCFNSIAYKNAYLYLLDDTRYADQPNNAALQQYKLDIEALCERMGINLFRHKWHHAKAGLINDFIYHQIGQPREGSDLTVFHRTPPAGGEKYIAIFDADQNPIPSFADPVLGHMEDRADLAFIQTPQYYTNFENNMVARAAGLQQAVFYEFICEGKGTHDSMMCCGTNVVFRMEALMDIGGFEEGSVTEDFATSLSLHMKHWASQYFHHVIAFGLGPEDLGGYFKQQYRWALGSMGVFKEVARAFWKAPTALPAGQWSEYLLSGSYYCIGFVYLIMGLCPVLYILFKVPSYFAKPEMYLMFFIPYFFLTLIAFYSTLGQRHYRVRDVLLGQILIVNSAPVYIRAVIDALLNRKKPFEITPKGESNALPLNQLKIYLICGAINLTALIWGSLRIYYSPNQAAPLTANMIWCLYHFVIVNFIFYFNNPEKTCEA